jgi:hypothetical protein
MPAQAAAIGSSLPAVEIAMFNDATEVLFGVGDRRRAADAAAPRVPARQFVKNADEAHRIALDGPNPIVGMSLDDLIDCSRSPHPNADQLVAIAAVHRGFLSLVARPGIGAITELKGKRVAVDTDTGYASALYEILRRNGIDRHRDLDIVYAGATNLRYEKLLRGEFDATLLGAPFTRMAMAQHFSSLATVIGVLGGYQAVVLVAQRRWLAENGATAKTVVTCLRQTLDWTAAPANRATLEGYVGDILPSLKGSLLSQVTDDLFGANSEFLRDGRMHAHDTNVVLALYNASRGAALTPATIEHLTDLDYLG